MKIKKILDSIAGILLALGIASFLIPFIIMGIAELLFFGSFGKLQTMDWMMDLAFGGNEGFPLIFVFIAWFIILSISSGLVHWISENFPN